MTKSIEEHIKTHPPEKRDEYRKDLIAKVFAAAAEPVQTIKTVTITGLYRWDWKGKSTFVEDVQNTLKQFSGKNIEITIKELPP